MAQANGPLLKVDADEVELNQTFGHIKALSARLMRV